MLKYESRTFDSMFFFGGGGGGDGGGGGGVLVKVHICGLVNLTAAEASSVKITDLPSHPAPLSLPPVFPLTNFFITRTHRHAVHPPPHHQNQWRLSYGLIYHSASVVPIND